MLQLWRINYFEIFCPNDELDFLFPLNLCNKLTLAAASVAEVFIVSKYLFISEGMFLLIEANSMLLIIA